jgi:hypothetical protein
MYPIAPKIKVWRARPAQSQKDPKMTISSAERIPTTLTTNKTLWLMQKHAWKESGKQRECLNKGAAKKIIEPRVWGCTIRNTVLHRIFVRKYGVFTEIRRIYGVYTAYNTYRFLIRKIRYVDTPPPPLYYTAYVPYNTYNYTYKVLANPVKTWCYI